MVFTTDHLHCTTDRLQCGASKVSFGWVRKLHCRKSALTLWFLSIFIAAGTVFHQRATAAIAYVQGNYAAPQTPQNTVAVRYLGAQAAGDLNVVIVGWNGSAGGITAVSDTKGNSYQWAVGPTQLSGALSQSIYYAKNIGAAAPGANLLTVQFSQAEPYADVRVLEYSGIDPINPLDVMSSSGGYGALSYTYLVGTTNATDLLVGANTVQTGTIASAGGFTQRLLTWPDGDIAEDRIVTAPGYWDASAPLSSSGFWVMQMAAFRAAGSPAPPVAVQLTAPAEGATLTGTITVSANASDTGNGVAGVQLRIDNVPYGVGTATRPYTFTLDTTRFANGVHVLQAAAWNSADQADFSSPVYVIFSNPNPGNPALTGMVSDVVPLPIVSVHTALLPDGRVFMSGPFDLGNIAYDWSYRLNTFDEVDAPWNMFCNGMDQMADGRLLVAGGHQAGHVGLPNSGIFDPATESWTVLPNMAFWRWYPTLTTLPDGRHIITSGEMNGDGDYCQIPEIYDLSTNSWTQLTSALFPFSYFYPHALIGPGGNLLIPASMEYPVVSQKLNLSTLTWTPFGGAAVDGGCTIQYSPGNLLKTGTSTDQNSVQPSASTAYVLNPSGTWQQVASMAYPRCYHNMTVLPNGDVLVTGGGTTTDPLDLTDAVLPTEIWNPSSGTWGTCASLNGPRLYHSIALLLPDGRVLVSGGGSDVGSNQPQDQLSAQFFSPPYLFQGPQPVITSAPSQISYGQNFTVQTPDAWRIAKVSLIRFGACTHSFNTGQHFIPLSFSIGNGALTVAAPANANLAPPGNYMLFLVGTNNVPSFAALVHF
jgi:hypothetical protein